MDYIIIILLVRILRQIHYVPFREYIECLDEASEIVEIGVDRLGDAWVLHLDNDRSAVAQHGADVDGLAVIAAVIESELLHAGRFHAATTGFKALTARDGPVRN